MKVLPTGPPRGGLGLGSMQEASGGSPQSSGRSEAVGQVLLEGLSHAGAFPPVRVAGAPHKLICCCPDPQFLRI